MTPDEYCQQRTAQERHELLLQLPVPAAGAAARDHRALRVLPRSRRRRRRGLRPGARPHEARLVAAARSAPCSPARRSIRWRSRCGPWSRPIACREEHFQTVIDGMAMDLERNRYLDFADLERYCHCVAGVVGLMSAEIFGYANPATLTYARDLGIAFQLTNIIRDVGEDARRGRIYLPQDELARHGVTAASLLKHETDARDGAADGRAGGARAPLAPARAGRAARRGSPHAAPGAHHGRHLSRAAGRDRARRLSRCSTIASR